MITGQSFHSILRTRSTYSFIRTKQAPKFLSFILVLLVAGCAWGQDMTFAPQSGRAHEEIYELINKLGICKPHCADVVKQASMRNGFLIQTHGIQDHSLLKKVEDIALHQWHSTPEMTHLIVEAYASDGIPPSSKHFNDGLIYSHEFRK